MDAVHNSNHRSAEFKEKNDILIATITQTLKAKSKAYWVWPAAKGAVVVTDMKSHPAESYLSAWKPHGKLAVVRDVFNDKINFDWESFDDCISLNAKMISVARKYELYSDIAEVAVYAAEAFAYNYEVLQRNLIDLLCKSEELYPSGGFADEVAIEPYVEDVGSLGTVKDATASVGSGSMFSSKLAAPQEPLFVLEGRLSLEAGEVVIASSYISQPIFFQPQDFSHSDVNRPYYDNHRHHALLLTNKASLMHAVWENNRYRGGKYVDEHKVLRTFYPSSTKHELAPMTQSTIRAVSIVLCEPFARAKRSIVVARGDPQVSLRALSDREDELRQLVRRAEEGARAREALCREQHRALIRKLHGNVADVGLTPPTLPPFASIDRIRREMLRFVRSCDVRSTTCLEMLSAAVELAGQNAKIIDAVVKTTDERGFASSLSEKVEDFIARRRREQVEGWKPTAIFTDIEDVFHLGLIPINSFQNCVTMNETIVLAIEHHKTLGEGLPAVKQQCLLHLNNLALMHEELCKLAAAVEAPLPVTINFDKILHVKPHIENVDTFGVDGSVFLDAQGTVSKFQETRNTSNNPYGRYTNEINGKLELSELEEFIASNTRVDTELSIGVLRGHSGSGCGGRNFRHVIHTYMITSTGSVADVKWHLQHRNGDQHSTVTKSMPASKTTQPLAPLTQAVISATASILCKVHCPPGIAAKADTAWTQSMVPSRDKVFEHLQRLSDQEYELHVALRQFKESEAYWERQLIAVKRRARLADGVEASRFPLHDAAMRDDTASMRAIIEAGVDINAVDNLGRTPLTVAAQFGKLAAVQLLLSVGAEPNLLSTQALAYASDCGHVDVCVELIKAGATASRYAKYHAGYYAVDASHRPIIQEILGNAEAEEDEPVNDPTEDRRITEKLHALGLSPAATDEL